MGLWRRWDLRAAESVAHLCDGRDIHGDSDGHRSAGGDELQVEERHRQPAADRECRRLEQGAEGEPDVVHRKRGGNDRARGFTGEMHAGDVRR